MHTWTDKNGDTHQIPRIEYDQCKRLQDWGVVDLIEHLLPDKTGQLFERLSSDRGFVVSMAYALEFDEPADEQHGEEFAKLLIGGDRGSAPWVECSEALRDAVIDFFPEERRDAIRQLQALTILETASQMMARLQDSELEESDSVIHTSGSNGTSDTSTTVEAA